MIIVYYCVQVLIVPFKESTINPLKEIHVSNETLFHYGTQFLSHERNDNLPKEIKITFHMKHHFHKRNQRQISNKISIKKNMHVKHDSNNRKKMRINSLI